MKLILTTISLFFSLLILGPFLDGNLIVDLPRAQRILVFIGKILVAAMVIFVMYMTGKEMDESNKKGRK